MALVVALVALTAGHPARAGVFGGFSSDETRFLRGTDQICTPLPAASKRGGVVACRSAKTAEVAAMGFRQGTVQSGPAATYRVDLVGSTSLRVVALQSGKCRAAWSTMDPISRVVEVSLSPGGKLIAIEYETRIAGRLRVDVVAFRLSPERAPAAPAKPAAAGGGQPPAARPGPPGAPPAPARAIDHKALARAIKQGWADLKKRRYAKAQAAFAQALSLDPDNPEAHYGHAAATVARKDRDAAVAELAALASSGHPDAPVWLVEARHDQRFRGLLGDPGFRKAVGIDPDPNRPPTAYERLVGAGGRWEQQAISCERPRVNLDLSRRPQRFDLRLRSKCKGMDETTRLDGSWTAEGQADLHLVFPNPGGEDERMACRLATCPGGSGEDCLTCAPGTELEMVLRLVRR